MRGEAKKTTRGSGYKSRTSGSYTGKRGGGANVTAPSTNKRHKVLHVIADRDDPVYGLKRSPEVAHVLVSPRG